MAQEVGYFEDDVEYTEGPFVIVNPMGNGWRIEVELVGHRCPVLTDSSIHELRLKNGWPTGKLNSKAQAAELCDWLNSKVRDGIIEQVRNGWVAVKASP
jgi:hypothetical protein